MAQRHRYKNQKEKLLFTTHKKMYDFQHSFEELIASSLSALDTITVEPTKNQITNVLHQDRFPGKNTHLRSSGSIDDFLMDYKHENTSILQFMTSLEEPELELAQRRSDSLHLPLVGLAASQSSLSCSLNAELAPSVLVTANRTPITLNSRAVASCKKSRTRMSPESKAELRRIKNREYQRRFREKRLRLELQQMFMRGNVQFSDGCFFQSSKNKK